MKCNKCNGSGKLGHYSHIDEGVCFACKGSGEVVKNRKPKGLKLPTVSPEALAEANRIIAIVKAEGGYTGENFQIKKNHVGFELNVNWNPFIQARNDSHGINMDYEYCNIFLAAKMSDFDLK